jgi:hypothetical protein
MQRILLPVEFLVMISYYLQRGFAIRVMDQCINLSRCRPIIEARDWHAKDRFRNPSESLVVSINVHDGIP